MLQVACSCNVQDIFKFMLSVASVGCRLHEPRQEAACVHPFGERQAVEKYLSPATFLQPYLNPIILHKAVLHSYSNPSGALGQQSGHWSGLLLPSFLFVFLLQSQARLPLFLSPLDHSMARERLVWHLAQTRDYKSLAWACHL